MADYDFYVNQYLGSSLSEKEFASCMAQAVRELERIRRLCRVEGGEQAEKLALCAMAETISQHRKRRSGISSARTGSVSVHYHREPEADQSLQRKLYRCAGIYLELYRGVGA